MTDAQRERFEALKTRAQTLRTQRTEALTLVEKWRVLAEMTHWSELDSGASITVGMRVRHLLHTYICTQAHTKALLRAPTNGMYWNRED